MATEHSKIPTPRLTSRISGGVFEITISNPARRNAMTLQMWRDLASRVHAAGQDRDARMVVVCGADDLAFCSGADISEFDSVRSTAAQVTEYGLAVDEAHYALTQCEKPTVALIQGICMGGGMEIAAACDIRYASESAQFRMPAGLVGLAYPMSGVARMVEIVGASRATDIFMTSRTFDGLEAARIGFAQEVFSDGRYAQQTRARLDTLAGSAPLSLKAMKLAIRHLSGERDLLSAQRATQAHDACFSSHDYLEGLHAFKEKRKPVFRGM